MLTLFPDSKDLSPQRQAKCFMTDGIAIDQLQYTNFYKSYFYGILPLTSILTLRKYTQNSPRST